MKNKAILSCVILVLFSSLSAYAVQLSGFVRDAQSGEVLIGANIWEPTQHTGTTTDNRGYFSIQLQSPCVLTISYIGYKTQNVTLQTAKDSLISIEMDIENNLTEVTVTVMRERKYDVTRLSAKELMVLPAIGSKPDVIKALQLLPGVQTQSEGMSLMMVRGGEPGQNQYLLDNVPLIYVNHLGGLMSVFNPDMINSVDFYKGNFPARQGGKLSSIVDITQREGDISKHQGSFGLGVTDAAVSFEGPLVGKKMSYIITARKTLVDALLAGASVLSDGNSSIVAYGFHDINAKLSWKPDQRNNLSVNLYQGDDYLNYWTKPWKMPKDESRHINQQWGNWLVAGRWNRVFSSKWYAENILSFSRYRNKSGQYHTYREENITQQIETLNIASVKDFSFRSAWKYSFLNNWNVDFGGHVSYLIYEPNYNYLSTSTPSQIGDIYHSIESAAYIDNKISLFSCFTLQPSLRISNFSNNGEDFLDVEPRVNLSYRLHPNHSLNFNYMRVRQNSHLVFAPAELLKREVWLPATSALRPELSNQFSASWNGRFADGKYTAETNVYYKKMEHLVTLKEGYENMVEITGIENKIESDGKGSAYGAEFMVKKNTGKWTGFVAYASSHADRTFANINGGKTYEFDYNRPHSFTLNANRDLGKNWTMSAVWIVQSGIPYTPALGKYFTFNPETGNTNVEMIYGTKNSKRMQPYHRLDLGFNHTITTKRGNKAIWTYSLYNAYNRINPFGYYYDNDNDTENHTNYNHPLQLYKLSLFSIIPSISYKVYFDYTKKNKTVKVKEKKRYNWLYY